MRTFSANVVANEGSLDSGNPGARHRAGDSAGEVTKKDLDEAREIKRENVRPSGQQNQSDRERHDAPRISARMFRAIVLVSRLYTPAATARFSLSR